MAQMYLLYQLEHSHTLHDASRNAWAIIDDCKLAVKNRVNHHSILNTLITYSALA